MDDSPEGEWEVEGGSEGKLGLLYSASSVPGYAPIGDPGMNGGEGAGGTKTGNEARGGERLLAGGSGCRGSVDGLLLCRPRVELRRVEASFRGAKLLRNQ